ncbi:MAG: hypothetical protein KatS3mg031_2956 [Chitinophagales bacterium]|nr:MAG: hypothetical protein KatS3mg031_2956 [Chitinophagales bacterium]
MGNPIIHGKIKEVFPEMAEKLNNQKEKDGMKLNDIKRGRPCKSHPDSFKYPVEASQIPTKNIWAWVNYYNQKGYRLAILKKDGVKWVVNLVSEQDMFRE